MVDMPILPSQRHLFDLPGHVAYLNCAYMGPLSNAVAEATHEGVDRKRHPWAVLPADFFSLADHARAAFATLLGAPATAEDIALVPAASYGMAVASANLPVRPGQTILVLAEEFPSTILTWRERARAGGAELVTVPRPADHDWTAAILAAIDDRTAVAALPAVHWIDGATIDLVRIGARLRQVGAALVLDLTQSLGARPFPLAEVDPDLLVVAAYKWLLSPYSTGFLYVAPRHQNGRPLEHHWFGRAGAQDFSNLGYPDGFQSGARRFDVGEPANFALLPGVIAALEQIRDWRVDRIAATAGAFTDAIATRAEPLGLTAVPTHLRARHYLGLKTAGALPAGLAGLLTRQGVHISIRGGRTLRITPHVYNEWWEVDRLFSVLEPAFAAARP
jgi:selenocysteine lyase/cysteine desulfurase